MRIAWHVRRPPQDRDGRRRFLDDALATRRAELHHQGLLVVCHGADEAYLLTGRSRLPAWLVYYDPDPDLQGSIRLELESYRPLRGFRHEPAHANLFEEDVPSRHLYIAVLLVTDEGRRGRSLGTRLVEAAKAMALDRGVELRGGLSGVDDVPRLMAFYSHLGFEVGIRDPPSRPMVGWVRWIPAEPPSSAKAR